MTDNNDVLYIKHRPKMWKEVIGQPNAVSQCQEMLKGTFPHAILFIGPSGTGKTTFCRVLKSKLECSDDDYYEINCAAVEPMDTVRDIQKRMSAFARSGKRRVWLLDEVQALSRAGFAQQALLKTLEDTPKHVYFFLATTDPTKVIPTIRNRCTIVNLRPIPDTDIFNLLATVLEKEKTIVPGDVLKRIVEVASGSARKALVHLHQVIHLKTEAEQIAAVQPDGVEKAAIDICRAIIGKRSWKEVAPMLKACQEDAEAVRRAILGYARSVLLGADGKPAARAAAIIGGFRFNYFDCGNAGLAEDVWNVLGKE